MDKFKVPRKLSTQNSIPRKTILQKWRNNKRLSQQAKIKSILPAKLFYKNFSRKLFRQKNYEAKNLNLHNRIKSTKNRINEDKIKFTFYHVIYSELAGPKVYCTGDQFHVTQFFDRLEVGVVSEWFKNITFIVNFIFIIITL